MSIQWKRVLALLITALWIWFIFARSAKPATESGAESAVLLHFWQRFLPGLTDHLVRKLAHFTEYFILGGLLFLDCRLWGRGMFLLPLGFGAVVACVDELAIQVNTPGRSGELRDVLLDTLGALAVIGLCLLLRRRKERRSCEKNGKES